MNTSGTWYVIWSEPRAEKRVAERLAAKGLEVWLPLVTHRRRWSDRWKNVEVPLFPGYVFVGTGQSGYGAVLQTPGVLTLVKHAGQPARLSNEYVASLRAAVSNPEIGVEAVPEATAFERGDEVVVQDGPLKGFVGEVVEVRGARRILLWVSAVGRGLLCSLGAASVRPVAG